MTTTLEPTVTVPETTAPTETDELLEALATHRGFLLQTVAGLTDEQARTRSTVSELHLAGLVKHLTETESQWIEFCLHGTAAFGAAAWDEDGADDAGWDPDAPRPDFTPTEDETLAVLLERYAAVAVRTEEVVRSLPDLGLSHALPVTPWWPEPGSRSARRTLVHVIAETAQHAGHADLLREAIDGQKTMG